MNKHTQSFWDLRHPALTLLSSACSVQTQAIRFCRIPRPRILCPRVGSFVPTCPPVTGVLQTATHSGSAMAAASAAVAVAGATVTTRTLASYLSAGSRLASALRSDGAAALADGSVLHVVMGNEACDADSIVSAITYGYLKDSTATAAAATGATATVSATELRPSVLSS